MADLTKLKEIQAAAYAAWKACPDKRRAEKARLAAELDAAAKAMAATKRAAAAAAESATAPVDTGALAAAYNARQAAKAAEEDLRRRVARAVRLLAEAEEWPRCGQDWGKGPGEAEADALIRANLALAQEIASGM